MNYADIIFGRKQQIQTKQHAKNLHAAYMCNVHNVLKNGSFQQVTHFIKEWDRNVVVTI
jgi:hypothetical protein